MSQHARNNPELYAGYTPVDPVEVPPEAFEPMKTTQHTQPIAPMDLAPFEGHTPGDWIDCGEGTLLHPVTKRPVTTRVIEATGWGRIGEWYDYSNESDANFELLKAAPQLLSELQQLRAQVKELSDLHFNSCEAVIKLEAQRDALAGALEASNAAMCRSMSGDEPFDEFIAANEEALASLEQ